MYDDPPNVPVRYTASAELLEIWRLTLEALQIPYAIVDLEETDGWSIYVPEPEADRAREALRRAEEEDRAEAPKRERERVREEEARRDALHSRLSFVPAVVFVGVLVWFAWLFGLGNSLPQSRWFELGANVLSRTRGEPWRAVTALTLHASGEHIAMNSLAALFMIPFACEYWGLGLGILLTLLAGALGNYTEAWLGGNLLSVGASTALFGALGVAGGTRLFRRGTTRKDVFLVATALLVMFAMFGIGGEAARDPLEVGFPGPAHHSNVDVIAHLLGFGYGLLIGGVARHLLRRRPDERAQWALGLVALVIVAGCWTAAALHG